VAPFFMPEDSCLSLSLIMSIVAVQIAAGLSSRMRGPNKLLQEVGEGMSLIQHTYAQLITSSVDEVVIVIGRDADQVELSISNCQLTTPKFVHNSQYEQGMTTSIQAGLKIAGDKDAVIICLSDMPLLKASDYDQLIDHFIHKGNNRSIVAPFRKGEKGNPVIFGSAYFQAILEHQELNGCSEIIKQNKDRLIRYETDSDAYFYDIDTAKDLENYRKRAE